MKAALVLPWMLGAAVVLQSALNRSMMKSWGLPRVVLTHATVLFILGIAYWFVGSRLNLLPPETDRGAEWSRWGFWIPGALGVVIVGVTPWTLQRLGALQTFVGLVAAQTVTSLAWDKWVEGVPINTPRILGALLTIAGVAIATWR